MPKVQFGDVARECRETYKGDQTGMPVVGLEHLEPETMTLHAWGSSADNSFTKYFHKGQVLFGRRRAYLKKAVVAPFDGICSGDITVIEAKADVLNPELLPFIVQNDDFFRFAVGHSAGSLSPRVKWEHLQNYEFSLPSMAEQGKLVELLQAMERTKNAYKNLIAKTDELVKSQFVEMFGDVVGAEYIPLKDCCSAITGGSTPSMAHPEYYGGSVPFIKSGDVKTATVASGALWLTEIALERTTAKYVPAGTVVVVTRSGILKHTLPVAITECPLVINQDLKAFQPKPEFTSQYLAYAIRSNEAELLSMARAMTVDNIETKQLLEIPIMCAALEMQKQFEDFVIQADKSKFAAQQALADLTATQKALMRQYLG